MVDIYPEVKRRGIYLALFTDPEGDSCFSIYQTQLDKNEKSYLKKTSLSRNFVYNYHIFGDFVKCIFMILLQIQHENNFLTTSKH